MSGESYSDDSSSLAPQHTTPHQWSAPTTPWQCHPSLIVVTPQPHYLGPTYPSWFSPPQPYIIPVPTPQASYEGTRQQFDPQPVISPTKRSYATGSVDVCRSISTIYVTNVWITLRSSAQIFFLFPQQSTVLLAKQLLRKHLGKLTQAIPFECLVGKEKNRCTFRWANFWRHSYGWKPLRTGSY